MHLWKYTGGFEAIDHANKIVYADEVGLLSTFNCIDCNELTINIHLTGLSKAVQRTRKLLAIPSLTISTSIQLLATNRITRWWKHLRNEIISLEARYDDRMGKQLGSCHQFPKNQ